MDLDWVVGVDVGGTKIAGALVGESGELLHEEVVPTGEAQLHGKGFARVDLGESEDWRAKPVGGGEASGSSREEDGRGSQGNPDPADPVSSAGRGEGDWASVGLAGTPDANAGAAVKVLALAERLRRRAAVDGVEVRCVGVGVPEYVDSAGRIAPAPLLASLSRLPEVTDSGLRVVVESDVRCAALAESRLGHGRGMDSFVFVIVGTGISHTTVVDGRLWKGHRGEAIALGELPVDPALATRPNAPLTVEEQASGRAISLAMEAAGEGAAGTETASAESNEASRIATQAGKIVAQALATVVYLIDPQAVMVGGGLGVSTGQFSEALRSHYAAITQARPTPPPLLTSALGPKAGLIGAGLAAHQSTSR